MTADAPRPRPDLATRDPNLRLDGPAPVLRRAALFGAALATTAGAVWTMADILSGGGLTAFEATIVGLFAINFLWIAISFFTAATGLVLVAFRIDPITLRRGLARPEPGAPRSRTVIVVPIYNEDARAVFARLRAMHEALAALGRQDAFDLFVLSDTRDPDIWIEEELCWGELRRDLGRRGNVFYRRRASNLERKSGNLVDFGERWAANYDFMIVLDADSVMSGRALVRMVQLMEANPDVGLIQAPPLPVGRATLFARILQFASSVHGPTMTAGLAFWQLGSGNYWGHNAILRTDAFIACCGLPVLPGKPPLGGPILSHDFVEAALLRRAGWKVWLVPDIAGSWEELPANVLDYAARDRRWCQGNLQHIRIVFGARLKPVSRLHLFMGVMAFVSSPLWLMLLLFSTLTAWEAAQRAHRYFGGAPSLFPAWPVDRAGTMLALLAITLGMLIVPKLLSAALLALRPAEARRRGGRAGLLASALAELVFSVLLAPAMMLFHSAFVVANLAGVTVGWNPQSRADKGVPLSAAARAQAAHVTIGVGWAALALWLDPGFFVWMSPVLAGLVVAPILTSWTSSAELGRAAARRGLFVVPEEAEPPPELARAGALAAGPAADRSAGLLRILEDPVASALHAALVPAEPPTERIRIEVGLLYEKLARLGPESLTADEKLMLLSYPVKPLDQIVAGHARSSNVALRREQ
jgi:membrane glycosyltransferase